jgi:transcriptional regulator with XRE-family HTH domain
MTKRTLKQTVARNIRAAREQADLERSELAELSGVHHANIIRLETATFSPRLDTLERLANALGIHVDALLREDPRRQPKQ